MQYKFRLWGKTLVVDAQSVGKNVARFDIGRVVGAENPRVVPVPLPDRRLAKTARPPSLAARRKNRFSCTPFSITHRTNSSHFWFKNAVEKGEAYCNGGSVYTPKTDGERNPCFERPVPYRFAQV